MSDGQDSIPLDQIRGEFRLKRNLDEVTTARRRMGQCFALAAIGILMALTTVGIAVFVRGGPLHLDPFLAIVMFVSLWLLHVGGVPLVIATAAVWSSFWILQAMRYNLRRHALEHEAIDADDPTEADFAQPAQDFADPPEVAATTDDPSAEPSPSRLSRVHLSQAGIDLLVPTDWSREDADGATLFMGPDEGRDWPLNMRVDLQPPDAGKRPVRERFEDVLKAYRLNRENVELEDSHLLVGTRGKDAATFTLRHTDQGRPYWSKGCILWSRDKTVIVTTTVLQHDQRLMQSLFDETLHQLLMGSGL